MAIINPTYEDFKNNQERALDYQEYRSTWDILRATSMYFKVAVKSEDILNLTEAIGYGLVTDAWSEYDDATGNFKIHLKVTKGTCVKDNQVIFFKDDFEFIYDAYPQPVTYYVYVRYKFVPENPDIFAEIDILLNPVPPQEEQEYMLIARVTVDPNQLSQADDRAGITIDLQPRSNLLVDSHKFIANNIEGGNDNTIVYQTAPDHTGFISAPTQDNQYLTWTATDGFKWVSSTIGADNLTGGSANQIVYQIDTNTTGFINEPTIARSYLEWNGTSFTWVQSVYRAQNIEGGSPNELIYQVSENHTSFVDAPTSAGQYLTWDGNNFTWDIITNVDHAVISECSNNLTGGDANQIPYQTATNTTDFIIAPTAENSYLTWASGNFRWDTAVNLALNIQGGNTNTIVYQSAPNSTGFITAPTSANVYLKWDGVNFTWDTKIALASNLAGGDANQIPFQIGADQTSFIPAPQNDGDVLTWDGAAGQFVWAASSSSTANLAECACNIAGGNANQIIYQMGTNQTTFIQAPSSANSYLKWDGNNFIWATATASTALAECANNLAGGNAYQIPFQTGTDQTSFIVTPPSGTEAYLHWTGTTFEWSSVSGTISLAECACNLAGGNANQIPFQTGANQTSFIPAPSSSSAYLHWNGSSFEWSSSTTSTNLAECANKLVGNGSFQVWYQSGDNLTSMGEAPSTDAPDVAYLIYDKVNSKIRWADGSVKYDHSQNLFCSLLNSGFSVKIASDSATANSDTFHTTFMDFNTLTADPGSFADGDTYGGAALIYNDKNSVDTLRVYAKDHTGANIYSENNTGAVIKSKNGVGLCVVSDNSNVTYGSDDAVIHTCSCLYGTLSEVNGTTGVLGINHREDISAFSGTTDQEKSQSAADNGNAGVYGYSCKTAGVHARTSCGIALYARHNGESNCQYAACIKNNYSNSTDSSNFSTAIQTGGVEVKYDNGVGLRIKPGQYSNYGIYMDERDASSTPQNMWSSIGIIKDTGSAALAIMDNYSGSTPHNLINVAATCCSTALGISVNTSDNIERNTPAIRISYNSPFYDNIKVISKYNLSLSKVFSDFNNDNITKAAVNISGYDQYNTLPGIIVRSCSADGGVYAKTRCFSIVGNAEQAVGVYGYAKQDYGTAGYAERDVGSYGYAGECYGGYFVAQQDYGVYGKVTNNYAVAGNTAYYNNSDADYKFLEDICVQDCLRAHPLKVYRYEWRDENLASHTEFIGPTVQDIEETFDLYTEGVEYDSSKEELEQAINAIPKPTVPKDYEYNWREKIDLYSLATIKSFEQYENELKIYEEKVAKIKEEFTPSAPKVIKGMYAIDGIAFALANENFQCILDFEKKFEEIEQRLNALEANQTQQ